MRRLRKAEEKLAKEGIRVICGRYLKKRQQAKMAGFEIAKDESISFDLK